MTSFNRHCSGVSWREINPIGASDSNVKNKKQGKTLHMKFRLHAKYRNAAVAGKIKWILGKKHQLLERNWTAEPNRHLD